MIAALARLAEHLGPSRAPGDASGAGVADHALADAVAVIGGDVLVALAARPDDDLLAELLATLQDLRESTRYTLKQCDIAWD